MILSRSQILSLITAIFRFSFGFRPDFKCIIDIWLINYVFFQHRDKHQEQVAQLRDEITEKATLMEELKDDNQKMTLAFEQLQRDHDKLKEDEQGKSKKLQEFQLLNEHREQAKQDLKGKGLKQQK